MRASLVALLFLAFVAPSGNAYAGDWQPYGPANGGYSVSTHPTIAGEAMIGSWMEDQRTFATSDAGTHWSGNPLPVLFYDRPRLAGTVAWVTWNRNLYRTTDRGRSWAPIAVPANEGLMIAGVNPANPQEIVLALNDGVFHSANAGTTWSSDTPPGSIGWSSVDWSTRRLYAVERTTGAVLRRPVDTAGAWQTTPANATIVAARHGVVIYASPGSPFPPVKGTLHRSTDQGATFAKVAEAFGEAGRFNDIAFTSSATRVYALDDQHVLRSDDGGATWADGAFMPGLDDPYVFAHVDADAVATNRLYVATQQGVRVSDDAGATVAPLERGTGAPGRSRSIAVDAVSPSRQWLVAPHLYTLETLLERTTDGGATWSVLDTGEYPIAASHERANTLFGFGGNGGVLRVSTDGGTTWSNAFQPFPATGYYFRAFAQGGQPPAVAVAGEDGASHGLHLSFDGGLSFAPRSTPPTTIRQLAFAPSSSSILYASALPIEPPGPILFRSTDGAATWQPVGTFAPRIPGWTANDVYAIAVDPRDPDRVYVGLALPDNLMRSDDGGATWTRVTAGLGAGAVTSIAIDPAQPDTLYAAVYLSGVFRSTNRGATWTALDTGLRDDSVRQVLLDPHRPGRLYAATNTGVFHVDLASTPPAGRRRAVEFHHAAFDHYFVSADVDEITGLDDGVFQGWLRTGYGTRVAEPGSPFDSPTCRFFGVGFGALSSHFYTPYPHECDIVKNDPNWQYEKIAFGLTAPENGCIPGRRPLFRAWNRNMGGAPNHRYTTNPIVLDNMIARGWVFEGEHHTRVFACVPVE